MASSLLSQVGTVPELVELAGFGGVLSTVYAVFTVLMAVVSAVDAAWASARLPRPRVEDRFSE